MNFICLRRRLALLICVLAAGVLLSKAQVATPAVPLTLEEVVKLQRAGFSEDVIITKIRKQGKPFDLSTEELLELHKIGVSDAVIRFLLDPAQPYVPPSAAQPGQSATVPPLAPAKQYPEDSYASKVPAEAGAYWLNGEAFLKINAKLLLGSEEKSGIGGLLKKGKIIGYVVGAESNTRIKDPTPIFYMRLAEGRAIEEIVLMALTRKNDRRELELGPSGKKQEFKAELMRSFDPLEVGLRLYRLKIAKLGKGEYLFLQIGSAEMPKGNYGKGFDFGIDEPEPPAKKN